MKPQRKIYNFFFSTTLGAWCFAFLLALFFINLSVIYFTYYGTPSGKVIAELNPLNPLIALAALATIITGLISVSIAVRNYWTRLGHNIICKFTYISIRKRNRSDMPYIVNIILINKKNRVEIIDKILFLSKKIGPTTVADFSENPISLKNYATKTISLDPVTAWASGISEGDIIKKTSTNLSSGYETKINTIREGANPIFYFTHHNYLDRKIKIAKIFAENSRELIPVNLDNLKYELQSAFPIRNTDHPANEYQEGKAIYGPRLIMTTELTLGPKESGEEPQNKEIKVLLYSNQEEFYFDSYIEENINTFAISVLFGSDDTDETIKFEKDWQNYYANAETNYKKFLVKMKEREQNNMETPPYAKTLEDYFHDQTASLLLKQDLPRISSKITSRILFLQNVQEFGEYPIVNKRHTLFATGFYPTEEFHPLFEEVEVEESIFAKIRQWCFDEAPPTSQKNAETDKRAK